METTSTKWVQQKSIPLHRFSNPIKLNGREFIITPTAIKDSHLYKYNIYGQCINLQRGNKWKEHIVNYDNQFGFGTAHITKPNEIHIFCGETSNKYLIWKPNAIDYELKHTFKEFQSLSNPGLVYLPNQNKLLLLGGYDHRKWKETSINSIYSFDFLKDKWTKESATLPKSMESFGCVVTTNEKYILMFGGSYNYVTMDDIYIMDTLSMTIVKSNMKCPNNGDFYAHLEFGFMSNDLIVFGFIRNCWNRQEFVGLRKPSDDIIEMIQMFHFTEIIHLFDRKKGTQWKIDIVHIMPETEKIVSNHNNTFGNVVSNHNNNK
eukprot:180588_1